MGSPALPDRMIGTNLCIGPLLQFDLAPSAFGVVQSFFNYQWEHGGVVMPQDFNADRPPPLGPAPCREHLADPKEDCPRCQKYKEDMIIKNEKIT